jgi:hypothetical protein
MVEPASCKLYTLCKVQKVTTQVRNKYVSTDLEKELDSGINTYILYKSTLTHNNTDVDVDQEEIFLIIFQYKKIASVLHLVILHF